MIDLKAIVERLNDLDKFIQTNANISTAINYGMINNSECGVDLNKLIIYAENDIEFLIGWNIAKNLL